jgi:beta-N-acetylhexosaminidase
VEDKYKVVDDLLGKLTLEQKVGQLFTQPFYGSLLVPDTQRTIQHLHCGGLRITQYFRGFRRYARPGEKQEAFDRLSPKDMTPNLIDDRKDLLCKPPYLDIPRYAALLEKVKQLEEDRPYHIPLHMMLDQEGGGSFDCIRGGVRTFPTQFGYARRGDAKLVHDVAKAVATQLSAIGFNMINSPVVDIVYDSAATYISTRSFGTDVPTVCKMAVAAMKGYHEGGLIASAKHFPGRGATSTDPHHDVGGIERSDEQLWNEDLAPYRAMIAEGLAAVMVGHSIYPAWDPDNLASVSEKIIRGVLLERLEFKGIIATDSMIMGAIAKKYGVARACVLAIKAGASAVLMKEAGPIREESYRLAVEAAKTGEISEAHIDGLLMRNLKAKVDQGLFGPTYRRDPKKAQGVARSKAMERIETKAAVEAVHVVRDRAGLLPLSPASRTLLVEEVSGMHINANDEYIHPGAFWEQLLPHSENVSLLEIDQNASEEDIAKVEMYMPWYETFIVTFYKNKNTLSSSKIIEKLLAAGKRVIVVTGSPLPYELPDSYPTVIATYGVMPPVLNVAAHLIYGTFTPKKSKFKRSWEA